MHGGGDLVAAAGDEVVGEGGGRDRAEECRAERATDLLRRVGHRRGDTRVVRLDAGRADLEAGGEEHAQAEAEEHEAGQDVREVRGIDADLGEQRHADGGQQHAGGDGDARADLRQQDRRRERRHHHDAADHRQEREARLDRRVHQRQLQVVRQEEEDAEHADAGEAEPEIGATARPVENDAQRQQRVGDAHLDHHEDRDQCEAAEQKRERDRRGPAVGLRLGAAVHDGEQAE